MRIGAKIGIGVFIILVCLSAVIGTDPTNEDTDEDGFIDGTDKFPNSPHLIYGTAGNEVAVGN